MDKIDERTLIERFGYSTFDKGEEYYNEGRVISAFMEGNRLQGNVVGTKTYRVKVLLSDLSNSCTCPIGGNCKHVVALLLFHLRNREDVIDLVKLREELKQRDKYELIDIIIEAVKGNDILSLIRKVDRKISIRSFFKIFDKNYVDENVVQNIADTIKMYKSKISKEDLLKLLERAIDCEDFGCYYDDYSDSYFSYPLFEAIGEALVEKELTQEDIETLKRIIDQD